MFITGSILPVAQNKITKLKLYYDLNPYDKDDFKI